jgi:hypothetical protein
MGFDCRCGGGKLQRSRADTKDTSQEAKLRAGIHGPDLKTGKCVRGEIRVRSTSPPPGLASVGSYSQCLRAGLTNSTAPRLTHSLEEALGIVTAPPGVVNTTDICRRYDRWRSLAHLESD